MSAFLLSPFSVPVLIVGIVMISTVVTRIAKMKYAQREIGESEEELKREIGELRRRIENLESIVLTLKK